jgi:hypothetical protein
VHRTDHSGGGHDGPRDLEDRVVSRRAGHGTTADAADERAYRAADPATGIRPDTDPGGEGGAAERAGADLDSERESTPTRSE